MFICLYVNYILQNVELAIYQLQSPPKQVLSKVSTGANKIQETIERSKVGSSDGYILEYTSLKISLLLTYISVPLPEFREGPGGSMS